MALSLPRYGGFVPEVRPGQPDARGNALVDRTYARLSPFYDVLFDAPLQPGRIAAVEGMGLQPGDRVLEIGTGTGIGTPLYPRDCQVTAIDLSAPMLDRARACGARRPVERAAARRRRRPARVR